MNNINMILFNSDKISLDLLSSLFILAVFFGIYVIITNNPVLSVLFLIGLFFIIAIYLILLGLHFIGLSYLLVYVGAVSMLFLFILMLINIRVSELFTDNRNSLLLAILTVLCFNFSINDSLPQDIYLYNLYNIYNNYLIIYIIDLISGLLSFQSTMEITDYSIYEYKDITSKSILSVGDKSWDSVMFLVTHISCLGNVLYTNLFMLSIVTSLILLLAMVGAIVITINSKSFKNVFSTPNLPNYVSARLQSGPAIPEVPEMIELVNQANTYFLEGVRVNELLQINGLEPDQLPDLHTKLSVKYSNLSYKLRGIIEAFSKKYDKYRTLCKENNIHTVALGSIHKLYAVEFIIDKSVENPLMEGVNPLIEGEMSIPIGKSNNGFQKYEDLYVYLKKHGSIIAVRFSRVYALFPEHDQTLMDFIAVKKALGCPGHEIDELVRKHISHSYSGRPKLTDIAADLRKVNEFKKVFPNGWPEDWT